ncbi:MAG: putative Ig domain-containing protein, partial [Candidatus Binatia bacterium]|nr:putative Ig domain-containing protein [Candidatus Binatia bacterium]
FLDRAFPSTQIEAIGGTPAYTWDISAGVLTTGLSLSAGGVLSGTPTALGTFNFTVRVTDSLAVVGTRDYQMIITAALNTITPQSYMGGVIPR